MDQKKICPRCYGNGFIKVKESIEKPVDIVFQCPMCNSEGEVRDKEFDDYFDNHMNLSHCSSTDIVNVGAAFYGGLEDKPNPISAVKMLKKKEKDE